MAHNYTVARPYARALFQQALEDATVSQWAAILQRACLVAEDQQVKNIVGNPKLSLQQGIDLFCDVIETSELNLTSELQKQMRNFISLVAMNRRLLLLPDMETLFHLMCTAHEGVVEVEVISVEPLESQQQQDLQTALEKRFASSITLKYSEDKDLIGGLLIKAGNWVMDGSIKGRLARLGETIRH